MGSRYLISGAQLGMIKGFCKVQDFKEIDGLVNELISENYVGQSSSELSYDVSKCKFSFSNLITNKGKRGG